MKINKISLEKFKSDTLYDSNLNQLIYDYCSINGDIVSYEIWFHNLHKNSLSIKLNHKLSFEYHLNYLINAFPKLIYLNLSHFGYTGQIFTFNPLKNLIKLNLSYCYNTTDHFLKCLSPLKTLKYLILLNCFKITDRGIKYISTLSSLIHLNLFNCNNITGLGLTYINKLKNIRYLNLGGCFEINNKSLLNISELKYLRHLNLSGSVINDTGLTFISKNFKSLETLNIRWCDKISQIGVFHLFQLPFLKHLCVDKCTNINIKFIDSLSKKFNKSLNLNCSNKWIQTLPNYL